MRMCQVQTKNENHALRSITAILMLLTAATHYHSKFNIDGINVSDVIFDFGRFAIPIFALISGYFCFSKDGHAENRIMKKAFHIFTLIIIYKLFYLIFSSVFCVAGGGITLKNIITEFLFVSDTFPMNCYGGDVVELRPTETVWFLYSLLLTYIFWFFLYRLKINFKWVWLLVIPLFIILLLFGEFLPMFHIVVSSDMRDLAGKLYPFVTLVFFVIGYFLHEYKEFIDARFSDGKIVAFIILGVEITCIECYLVPKSTIMYVGSVIVAVFLFLGTFRISKDKFRSTILEYMGRQMVVWMYIFFSAANFLTRYLMQSYAHSYIICEVIGLFLATILDLIMALTFHLFLKYIDNKKVIRATSIDNAHNIT